MKRLGLTILIFALLLALPSVVVAQEEAKYSFASAQGASSLQVIPGGEARGVIYFYNVDGNRITHITLEVVQAPDNWEVEIDPPLHDQLYEFGGATITVSENLYAEPTELSLKEIEDVPEGTVCLTLPERGYALAKPAYIIVRVPESEEVGITGEIKITAEASWLGQTGAEALGQKRDFDFTVTTVYEITDEIPITPVYEAPAADFSVLPTSGTAPLTVQFTDKSTGDTTSWEWDFNNDGRVDSTQQNPSYTYETAGKYIVSLEVTGPGGSDIEIKSDFITVEEKEEEGGLFDCTCSRVEGRKPLGELLIGWAIVGLCWGSGYYLVRRVSRRRSK